MRYTLILLLLLAGCDPPPKQKTHWVYVYDRETGDLIAKHWNARITQADGQIVVRTWWVTGEVLGVYSPLQVRAERVVK